MAGRVLRGRKEGEPVTSLGYLTLCRWKMSILGSPDKVRAREALLVKGDKGGFPHCTKLKRAVWTKVDFDLISRA